MQTATEKNSVYVQNTNGSHNNILSSIDIAINRPEERGRPIKSLLSNWVPYYTLSHFCC